MSSGAPAGHSGLTAALKHRAQVFTTCPTGHNRDPSRRCRQPILEIRLRFATVCLKFFRTGRRAGISPYRADGANMWTVSHELLLALASAPRTLHKDCRYTY